ncbi:insulinase, putative [Cryptosporidium muris RN66]|uniref:Insulinase, putative n=1 Tax=Cryptosporidium muris (strain RN66) TaxID=441375 RepID=B6AGX7_CRYMR|nr:insulinase, putative [Cryptosporidium muris RN66]EEA07468.1 insulinase, putative [Cryptosporidium muris RN66]|eukprot:XP_002141817.1 insulinase [Cryptosporidium muris RN66]
MFYIYALIYLLNFSKTIALECSISRWKIANSVVTPQIDTRKFKNITLENGLSVMLVEDTKAEKAGFGMAVNVGSFEDPEMIPGLAHLLEHMLFLGTIKYPDPKSYDEFMSQHGGQSNAYTSEERTVYFNEINEEFLDSGLDYFSQFFKSPLLDIKMIEREVHAIDSEHAKNIPNEIDRIWYTVKTYAYPPFSHFTTGNIETLIKNPKDMNLSIEALLKNFFLTYYCAKNMYLTIYSRRTIKQLEFFAKMYFSDISDNNGGLCGKVEHNKESNSEPEKDRRPIFKEENLGKLLHVKSIGELKILWFVWNFPGYFNISAKHPMQLLSYILNSQIPGSLTWNLQKTEMIVKTIAFYEIFSYGILFIYQLELTNKGVKNYEYLVSVVNKYINKLRDSKDISSVYEGVKTLSEREFVMQKEMYGKSPLYEVSEICSRLLQFGVHGALSGDILIEEIDEKLIKSLLNYITPNNTLIVLSEEIGPKFVHIEKDVYYGVEHAIIPISNEKLKKWLLGKFSQIEGKEVIVPMPSKCVPLNFIVLPTSDSPKTPITLSSGLANVWWIGPVAESHKISIRILLRFPRRYSRGVETQAWGLLISYMIKAMFENELGYYKECGVDLEVQWTSEGFQIDISSFSYTDDIETILNTILSPIINKYIKKMGCSLLEKAARSAILSSANFREQNITYLQARELIKMLQSSSDYSEWEIRYFLKSLFKKKSTATDMFQQIIKAGHSIRTGTIYSLVKYISSIIKNNIIVSENSQTLCHSLNRWVNKLLHRLSIIAFIQGNITKNKAKSLIENFVLSSNIFPLKEKYAASKRVYKILQPLDITLYNPNPHDENNIVLQLYQFGKPTFEERINLMGLQPLVHNYMYDRLRTKLQLGYIVAATIAPIGNTKALIIGIQGSRENSVETLQNHIKLAIDSFIIEELANMKVEVYSSIKESLIEYFKTLKYSFPLHFHHYWDQIISNKSSKLNEAQNENAIDYIQNILSIQDLYNTFIKLIRRSGDSGIYILKMTHRGQKTKIDKNKLDREITHVLSTARETIRKNGFYEVI